jgi:hypothetical protein
LAVVFAMLADCMETGHGLSRRIGIGRQNENAEV